MRPADVLYSTPKMVEAFSGEAQIRGMLAFEAALARAEARAGAIPADAADAIAAACRDGRFDPTRLYQEAVPAGVPAIPLVRMLTEQVEGDGRRYVHWGATSQDAVDTAMVLQVRQGLDLLVAELLAVGDACAALAERHRGTLLPARTLLQQALPISFGLKAARWLAMVGRDARALRVARAEMSVVQFGGAAGTRAALQGRGAEVERLLAEELGLAVPDLPWHTERDRVARLAGALGAVAGSMAKVAGDLLLMAQTELGEVAEGAAPGKGGSSAMPQKRNPVDAIGAMAAARLALGQVAVLQGAAVQEQERAAGGWQAEWAALPDLFCYTAGAAARVRSALAGLEVEPGRMRQNLALSGGLLMSEALSMALAERLGKERAHRAVQALARQVSEAGGRLRDAALADETVRAALGPEDLDRALDPAGYLGDADDLIDRALVEHRALRADLSA